MGFRYIGAKSRVIGEVLEGISKIVPSESTIADLMSGTGSVCTALKQKGYNVIANDLMTYSYHHTRVVLHLSKAPEFILAKDVAIQESRNQTAGLFPPETRYEAILEYLNNVEPIEAYFFNEFGPDGSPENGAKPRRYFTPGNAKKIDGVRSEISKLHQAKRITDLEHSLLIHDLIMATNDVANIAGTYGHYLSTFVQRAKSPLRLQPTRFVAGRKKAIYNVLQGYAEDLAHQIQCDLCYIDPPYIKRQYAANYHILETIARGDNPPAVGASGLRPWRDQYSNFCTKTRIEAAFSKIVADMDCENFLISYSEEGLLSIERLTDLLQRYGSVKVSQFKNKRFKSNLAESNPWVNEYLIYLRRG